MTKGDFVDWKNSPITKALFQALNTNIEGLKEELAGSAGVDTRADAIKVGAIQAYRDVVDAEWFEETK
jgi:hypothetical protein